MALGIQRQRRKNMLLKNGFLPFEAQTLSKVPLDAPWIRDMIRERARAYGAAINARMSVRGWREIIRDIYVTHNLIKRDKIGRLRLDPWQNMRRWEEIGRTKYPEYESPSRKKPRKSQKDFSRKYDKGLEAYERGRGRY